MNHNPRIGPAALEILPAWARREQSVASMLPYVSLVDDLTVRTRGNELLQCIRVSGLNSLTTADAVLDRMKDTFASIIAQTGDKFAYTVHKVSRRIDTALPAISEGTLAAQIDRRWQSHMARTNLREHTITITVIKRPDVLAKIPLSRRKSQELLARQIDGQVSQLHEVVEFLCSALSKMNPQVLTASSGDLLGFLESINTGIEVPTFHTTLDRTIAETVSNTRVTFKGDKIYLTGGSLPDRVGMIYSIKEYPRDSFVTMFDELDLPVDMVVSNYFVPINNGIMEERIARELRRRAAINDKAGNLIAALGEAQNRLASGEVTFGHHQMAVAIYADSEEELGKISSMIRQVAVSAGVKMVSQAYTSRTVYFGQHPCNRAFRIREGAITSEQFADMAALHRAAMGKSGENVPWATPITWFPTISRSGYRFSFHEEGDPAKEPSNGHTLVLGRMGSGKSVQAAFLAAQAQRVGARVFVFDYRRGMEMAVRALGGRYSELKAGERTGLNPLWVETDTAGQEWLSDWLIHLMESGHSQLHPEQSQAIKNAVRQNAEARNPNLRTWTQFAQLVGATHDGGTLADRLNEWTEGHRFGWIFGREVEDNFSLDGQFVGFDLTDILDSENPRARMAVLSYIFRRIERKIEDKRPTIIIIDEAWKALDNSYFAGRIENWLVTARKQNTVVVMMTQFAHQLNATAHGRTLLQALPTKMLLPNKEAGEEDYAGLGLNPKELDILVGVNPGSRLALVRSDDGSHVIDTDLSALGPLLTILGGMKAGEALVGTDYRTRPDFWKGFADA
ncbi:MAG: type IV secretion system protein B4 [Alphaproteobacteria bacterium]|nr:type IV secretion system protein B4 [Alphaproteobacteria bacterium]